MKNSVLPKVQVLLSAYNGEKYVLEQLESLRLQDYGNFTVKIRDDGSKDETFTLVSEYIKNNKLDWEVHKGENLGFVKSFFWLLFNASEEADFYSFCDQDDYWKKEKISRAVGKLQAERQELPLLYSSQYTLVDKNLNPFSVKHEKADLVPSFKGALFVNIVTGCTIVLNKKMRELVISKQMPNCVVHDWWLYLVASAFGKVVFDAYSTIFYRMHGNNVCGTSTSSYKRKFINFFKMLRGRLYLRRPGEITEQVKDFKYIYSDKLTAKHIKDMEVFLDRRFINRLRIFLDIPFWKKSSTTNGQRVRFLFNSI